MEKQRNGSISNSKVELEKKIVDQEALYFYYINELQIPRGRYKDKEEAERRMPKEETTVFKTGNKKLIFVGGVHTIGDNNFTQFLGDLLEKEKPKIVLVEERRNKNPSSKLDRIRDKERSKWTEVDWIFNWGAEHLTPVRGMDIRTKDELIPYINHFGSTEGTKIGIFQTVLLDFKNPYIADPNKKLSLEEYYDLAVESTERRFNSGTLRHFKDRFIALKEIEEYRDLSIKDFIKVVFEEEAKKYVSNANVLEILNDDKVKAPYPFEDKYKTNKLWVLWGAARDSAMIEEMR